MGLESNDTNTIEGLDQTWPLGNDPTLDGDNHLRLIKRVLKAMFPGEGGSGFSEPIIATETEINHLTGLQQNVQQALEDLNEYDGILRRRLCGPNGLILPTFNISSYAVPNGWKRLAVNENYMMVATTTEFQGLYGGKNDPILFTHNHSQPTIKITAANLPPHSHDISAGSNNLVEDSPTGGTDSYPWQDPWTGSITESKSTKTTGTGWGSNEPVQLPNTNENTWEPRAAGFQLIQRDINLGQG